MGVSGLGVSIENIKVGVGLYFIVTKNSSHCIEVELHLVLVLEKIYILDINSIFSNCKL